jgi:hypothetical protein
VDTGSRIDPNADEAARAAAIEEFNARRKAASEEAARLQGAKVSAENRHARIVEGCQRIRDRWGWPSNQKMAERWGFPDQPWVPTLDLRKEAGAPGKPLAYNSIATELGGREVWQRKFLARLKREATRTKETP